MTAEKLSSTDFFHPKSRLGLGLAALGRPSYINLGHAGDVGQVDVTTLERKAHAVLDAAYAGGVRHFDAARSYGNAEAFLSSWLNQRRLTREDVSLSSKWGYVYTANWRADVEQHEVKDHSLANFCRQSEESLALVGAWLGLYQIHSATFESGVLENTPVLEALARMRENGIHLGLSLSGPSQADVLRRAMQVRLDGVPLFSGVQATWNLLEPSAGDSLAEAHARGLCVIVKEAHANGRLSPRARHLAHFPALEKAALRDGLSLDAYALAAALSQPWASVVLSGASTVEQMESHVRGSQIPIVGVERLIREIAQPPSAYWAERSRLPWT